MQIYQYPPIILLFVCIIKYSIQNCTDIHCSSCSSPSVCTDCYSPYGVNISISYCQVCYDLNCQQCSTTNNAICLTCTNLYGVTTINNTCILCTIINCIQCSTDANLCTACSVGFGYDSGTHTCITCNVAHCLECSTNINICQRCNISYGVLTPFNTSCQLCYNYIPNCIQCQYDTYICTACSLNYGLSSSNSCISCNDTNCKNCSQNTLICSQCDINYGVHLDICILCTVLRCDHNCSYNSNYCLQCILPYGVNLGTGQCQICIDINCANCVYNKHICMGCIHNYGISQTNYSCILCMDQFCMICTPNYTICTKCRYQHGFLSATNSTCVSCTDTKCWMCFADHTVCLYCMNFYGLNITTGICQSCVDPNCQDCGANKLGCSACKQHYGLNNSVCVPCFYACALCQPSYLGNFTICLTCIPKYYQSGYYCLPCIAHCLNCTNNTQCVVCQSGYTLTSAKICVCPLHCTLCHFNATYSLSQCTQCQQNYSLNTNLPPTCSQTCGDSWTILYPCDNQINIPYDGCDNNCQPMNNFTCTVNNINYSTICSYNIQIQITFVSINRKSLTDNQFILKLSLHPPLYIFSLLSSLELLTIFNIINTNITTKQISYNSTNNQLQILSQFNADLVQSNSLKIQFNPNLTINTQKGFNYTPNVIANITINFNQYPLYYYSQKDKLLSNMIQYLCYVSVSLGWFGLLVGFILRKLSGIQTMFVIQWSWIIMIWLKIYLLLPFMETFPLKYSVGYNYIFFKHQYIHKLSSVYPFVQYFGIDQQLLINNYNLLMLFIIIPIPFIIFTYARYYKVISINLNMKLQQQIIDKIKQLQQSVIWACIALFYGMLLNLQYFIACSIGFFKFGDIHNIASIIIFIFGFLFIGCIFAFFHYDTPLFGEFWFSFNSQQKITLRHYYFHFVILIVSTIILVSVPAFNILAVIPILAMFVYTLIKKPYKNITDNYRSAFNLFVMIFFMLLKGWIQYCPTKMRNSMITYAILISSIILLIISSIIGVFYSIYRWYYEKFTAQQQKNNLSSKSKDFKVLVDLNQIQVTKKIKKVQTISVFRDLLGENVCLKDASNAIKNIVDEQAAVMKRQQKQYYKSIKIRQPIKLQNIHQDGINKYKQNLSMLKQEMIVSANKKKKKNQTQNLEQDKDLQSSKQIIVDNQKTIMQQKNDEYQIANRVIVEQNKQINLKGAVQFIQNLKEYQQKQYIQNKQICFNAYQQIGKYQG